MSDKFSVTVIEEFLDKLNVAKYFPPPHEETLEPHHYHGHLLSLWLVGFLQHQ
jgi:hypothetical protein